MGVQEKKPVDPAKQFKEKIELWEDQLAIAIAAQKHGDIKAIANYFKLRVEPMGGGDPVRFDQNLHHVFATMLDSFIATLKNYNQQVMSLPKEYK